VTQTMSSPAFVFVGGDHRVGPNADFAWRRWNALSGGVNQAPDGQIDSPRAAYDQRGQTVVLRAVGRIGRGPAADVSVEFWRFGDCGLIAARIRILQFNTAGRNGESTVRTVWDWRIRRRRRRVITVVEWDRRSMPSLPGSGELAGCGWTSWRGLPVWDSEHGTDDRGCGILHHGGALRIRRTLATCGEPHSTRNSVIPGSAGRLDQRAGEPDVGPTPELSAGGVAAYQETTTTLKCTDLCGAAAGVPLCGRRVAIGSVLTSSDRDGGQRVLRLDRNGDIVMASTLWMGRRGCGGECDADMRSPRLCLWVADHRVGSPTLISPGGSGWL